MKKLIKLSLTVALFSFITSGATAQKLVNKTACDMEMVVNWGTAGCTVNGTFNAIVPAFSAVAYPLPAGDVVVAAKGTYVSQSGCPFYVGIACTPYPVGVFVPCALPCGDYKAKIFGVDVVAYQ